MEIFSYTANGIIPVFLVIFVGMALQKLGFFSQTTKDEIIKLVFYAATPCLIFKNVSGADLYSVFDLKFIIFTMIMIVMLLLFQVFLCFWIKEPAKKGAVIQIGFRSNFAIIGMPIAINLLSKTGVALTAVTLSFVIVTYNICAVTLLSYYGTTKKSFKSIFTGITKNPLIIGTVAGLIFAVFKIPVAPILDKTIDIIGDIASSMGLIIIGATISLKGFTSNKAYILFSVFLRNILSPFLFLTIGALFGYRDYHLMILAIISASPAAVNCFVMAKNMGVDSDISAYGVSLTSIVSLMSIFVSVYLIKLFGLA